MMNKFNKNVRSIFSLIVVAALCASTGYTAPPSDKNGMPTDDYEFPVSSEKTADIWDGFGSLEAQQTALQIPSASLQSMSTEGLLETCQNYPLLWTMTLSNQSPYAGFLDCVQTFNGFSELLERPDAGEQLYKIYQVTPLTWYLLPENLVKRRFIEYMLAQEPILNELGKEKRGDLLNLCKSRVQEIRGIENAPSLESTALLICRIMRMDDKGFSDIVDRNCDLQKFLTEGTAPGITNEKWNSYINNDIPFSTFLITPVTIYTPNGTTMVAYKKDEMADSQIQQYDNEMAKIFPNAIKLRRASSKYNCASFAWYYQGANNDVTISDEPTSSFTDGSYRRIATRNDYTVPPSIPKGAVVTYEGKHVALKYSSDSFVSKWGDYGLYIHKSNESPYSSPTLSFYVENSNVILKGDVNNDGREDVIASHGVNGKRVFTTFLGNANGTFSAGKNSTMTNGFYPNDPVFAGDINGDGRTDLIVHWRNADKRQLLVYTGKADGTFNAGVNFASSRRHLPDDYPCQFFVGDVNGDGRDDFVVQWRTDDGKRSNLVYRGTAAGTFLEAVETTTTNRYVLDDPVYMGDVNGDGKADLVAQWINGSKLQLLVYTGKADGKFNTGVNFASTYSIFRKDFPRLFLEDVTGDGRDDFVFHGKDSAGLRKHYVYRATSSGTFTEAVTSTTTNRFVGTDSVLMGDVNGDGRSDLVVHWVNGQYRQLLVYTGNVNGTFNAPTNFSSNNRHDPRTWPAKFMMGDFTGDGKDDFLVDWKYANIKDDPMKFYTYRASGSTFLTDVSTTTSVPYFGD